MPAGQQVTAASLCKLSRWHLQISRLICQAALAYGDDKLSSIQLPLKGNPTVVRGRQQGRGCCYFSSYLGTLPWRADRGPALPCLRGLVPFRREFCECCQHCARVNDPTPHPKGCFSHLLRSTLHKQPGATNEEPQRGQKRLVELQPGTRAPRLAMTQTVCSPAPYQMGCLTPLNIPRKTFRCLGMLHK